MALGRDLRDPRVVALIVAQPLDVVGDARPARKECLCRRALVLRPKLSMLLELVNVRGDQCAGLLNAPVQPRGRRVRVRERERRERGERERERELSGPPGDRAAPRQDEDRRDELLAPKHHLRHGRLAHVRGDARGLPRRDLHRAEDRERAAVHCGLHLKKAGRVSD